MRTVALQQDNPGASPRVTLELNEFELVTLVALVEEGRRILNRRPASDIQPLMDAVAEEFLSILGHLELLPAND